MRATSCRARVTAACASADAAGAVRSEPPGAAASARPVGATATTPAATTPAPENFNIDRRVTSIWVLLRSASGGVLPEQLFVPVRVVADLAVGVEPHGGTVLRRVRGPCRHVRRGGTARVREAGPQCAHVLGGRELS